MTSVVISASVASDIFTSQMSNLYFNTVKIHQVGYNIKYTYIIISNNTKYVSKKSLQLKYHHTFTKLDLFSINALYLT